MLKPLIIACLTALISGQKPAAPPEPWVTRDVLILQSTKAYQVALATARRAAARLHTSLNLEGYRPNAKTGLTMSKAACADNGFAFPAYVARGREYEKGAFVSLEFSSTYKGFAKGYYLVVAAVGEPGAKNVRQSSILAKQWYPDAYAKRTQVWVGCIH